MIAEMLLSEFMQETESTRKLLNAIPDSALNFKPSPTNWTTAELASHIANIYHWYSGVFSSNTYEMTEDPYEPGDMTKMSAIVARFEENAKKAQSYLEKATDEDLGEQWSMLVHGREVMPPAPRAEIVRGFLMNHTYHHRGEMIIYLRASSNKVPGMYGPVFEDAQKQGS